MSEEEDEIEYLGKRMMHCCDKLKRIDTDAVFIKQTPQHPRERLRKINTGVFFVKQTPQHP